MKDIRGQVYMFFGFVLAGTSVISARFVTGKLGTFTVTAVSLFFAMLFLIPFCSKGLFEVRRKLTSKDCGFMLLQALFGIFLFRMFLLNGLKLTSTGEAGILTGASPAITAILAILLLREPVNFRKLMGIAGTVTGISLIQGFFSSGTAFSIKHFWGNILILCAASCESVFNIFSRVFAVKKTVHNSSRLEPTVQTLIVTAIAMVLCLVPAMFEQPMQRLHEIGPTEWLALLWYGIFVTALAFIFWYSGIKRCGALTAAAFSGIMPFTSMLLSVVVLGESVVQRQWIGGTLIILGMVLIGSGSAARTIHTPQATQ